VIGPLLGLAGYELLGHRIRPLLVIAVVPAMLSAALVAAVRPVLVVLALFALVNFPDALLLLRLDEIGFPVTALILAYVTYNLVYAAASYPAGLLADRVRPRRVFAIGLAFFALGYLGLGLVHSHLLAWALLGAYGLFAAATDGVGKAWISGLVHGGQQSWAQGLYQGISGLGILIAGVWAGLLWGSGGRVPLLVSGSVAVVLAALLLAGSPCRTPAA
jgi:MFS family permease